MQSSYRLPYYLRWLGCAALAVGGMTFGSAHVATAHAASYTVTSSADVRDAKPGDGVCETAQGNRTCTLRAAIEEANAHPGTSSTITLPAKTYALTRAGRDEDAAATGDLDITTDMHITGALSSTTIIDGNQLDRIFHIPNAATRVTIENVTLRNGDARGEEFGYVPGGAILNNGDLTVMNTTISNNRGQAGGGLSNTGTLRLNGSVVRDNQGTGGEEGGSTGGGLTNSGILTIERSLISNNYVYGSGSGIENLWNGSITITNSRIVGNSVDGTGGGIDNSGALTISDSMISSNHASEGPHGEPSQGGGIASSGALTITNTVVAQNSVDSGPDSIPGDGGGIASSGTFSARTLVVNHNSATGGGGGMIVSGLATLDKTTISNNNATDGGGFIATGTIAINASTVAANTATMDGGGGYSDGGLSVTNSTFSGNSADKNGGGLAINTVKNTYLDQGQTSGDATLVNVTITDNTTDADHHGGGDGGGIVQATANGPASVVLINTLIGQNRDLRGEAPDCAGVFVSRGYNLIQSIKGCTITGTTTGNVIGKDPLLAPLGSYGGATKTHALRRGSPAIDAANNATCPSRDQRGARRPRDGDRNGTALCDIGAYELQPRPGAAHAHSQSDEALDLSFTGDDDNDFAPPSGTAVVEPPTQSRYTVRLPLIISAP